jgi:hypothetical protein
MGMQSCRPCVCCVRAASDTGHPPICTVDRQTRARSAVTQIWSLRPSRTGNDRQRGSSA